MRLLDRRAKILLVRFSSLGDIILTGPVIRCVKNQLNCRVDFISKKAFREVLNSNPNIHKVHFFERDWTEIKKSLISEKYDLIIDLHNNLRSFRLIRTLGVPSISFDKINIRKWIKVNLNMHLLPETHLVDRYFASLERLGIQNDLQGLDYFFPESMPQYCLEKYPFILDGNYFVLCLGASYPTKQISYQLGRQLIDGLDEKVVLIGGKDVVDKANALKKCFGAKVINLAGRTTINESAFLIEKCLHFITGDTGMMHIGAALRTPMSVIWGNTIPEFGMYPYYGQKVSKAQNFEVKNLACRPCSKLGKIGCPKGHFHCMNQISANDIISGIKSKLVRN